MTQKYQRPSSSHDGEVTLSNRTKYQNDAAAVPKVAISSTKIDGDFNYLVDALNTIDEAAGNRGSIEERLSVVMNADGSLKASVASALDDWVSLSTSNITRIDNSTFSCDGGHTSLLVDNLRVRIQVSGVTLFGSVTTCTESASVSTISLVDITDASGDIQVISVDPSVIAYSPIIPGASGNNPSHMKELSLGGISISSDTDRIIMNGSYAAALKMDNLTADRELSLSDKTGTIAMLDDIIDGSYDFVESLDITSATTTVDFEGAFDGAVRIHKFTLTDLKTATGTPRIRINLGYDNSGSVSYRDASGDYMRGMMVVSSGADLGTQRSTSSSCVELNNTISNSGSDGFMGGVVYVFEAENTSVYTHLLCDTVSYNASSGVARGCGVGRLVSDKEAAEGVRFYAQSEDLTSGTIIHEVYTRGA